MPQNSPANENLPPYTYVPGWAPHPVSDPAGHMYQQSRPADWDLIDYVVWGQRLLNEGYFWEAHEAWEHVWLELGRKSAEAQLVKGLIKLAAAAVKCREGNHTGAHRHAIRSYELLGSVVPSALLQSVDLTAARRAAEFIRESPPINDHPPSSLPVALEFLQI